MAARRVATLPRPLLLAALVFTLHAPAQTRSNVFNEPFVQVMAGLPGCPVPDPPGVTPQELRELAHDRAQRGVSCWLDGRCRLPNAYLYDAEIIPRVQQALRYAGGFTNTSIWAAGSRRFVWLQGCVTSAEQAAEAERIARRIDDVEGVVNQLMIGTGGSPDYRVAPRD